MEASKFSSGKIIPDTKGYRIKLQKRKASEPIKTTKSSSQSRRSQVRTTILNRSSSPDKHGICEHCEHQHARTCCLYIYDDLSDIANYSHFKQQLDKPYSVTSESDDFYLKIFNTTPSHFPNYTVNDPSKIDRNLQFPKPVVYLRQFFWPVFLPPVYHVPTPINHFPIQGNFYTNSSPITHQFAIPVPQPAFKYQYQLPFPHQQIFEHHTYMPIQYC